ncbi:MAG: hypothetical protein ACLR4Z_17220 [Butyricicoccaceae bacterium]
MLLSPAYAAESGTSDSSANAAVTTAAEARSVKLVFASDKTLTGANGDTVKEIFRSRLDALGCKDYTLTVADDGSTITVEFPASAQVSISQSISCSRRPFPHPTRTARYG